MKSINVSDLMGGILFDIQKERERQEILLIQGKFPWSCSNLKVSDVKKLAVLGEEFGEAAKEAAQIEEQYDRLKTNEGRQDAAPYDKAGVEKVLKLNIQYKKGLLREELIQVAAVCVAWCEALDTQLDDRSDFPAEEQASLSSNLADIYTPTSRDFQGCTCKPYLGPGSRPGDKELDRNCKVHK